MRLDDRDIICEQDYSPLSNAELVEAIERYAAIMSNAPLIDFDLEWITGPARALLARAEAAEARAANEALAELAASETERRVALAERVAELEAQLASADDEIASASAQAARFWRTNNKLAERVAELEAERALLIADVCRVGKETCPYCGITLASGKCEECDWPRRYSLELETAAKVFAAPPPDAPTEPTP